ncbi:MAG: ATP-binding cassette domain-containing protein [Bacteroidota bacterium]
MNPLFRIRNLQCSYDGMEVVVHIPELDIPRGGLIGLMSVSGGGKSTTLETLGLMNHTFLPGSDITFFPDEEGEGYAFEHLWKSENDLNISRIRNEHYSFIFQKTNLMPNFTAYENICITQMIQGKSRSESIQHARQVMDELGLEKVDEQKKAFELSGGEQQRVAFVRAITPSFTVLFGDEPTGNLDVENSRILMSRLCQTIEEKNRTAIIVSHNIGLMEEFADMLLVLQKPQKTGILHKKNIFTSQKDEQGQRSWMDSDGNSVPVLSTAVKRITKLEDVL